MCIICIMARSAGKGVDPSAGAGVFCRAPRAGVVSPLNCMGGSNKKNSHDERGSGG